jgi:hypothetical protein
MKRASRRSISQDLKRAIWDTYIGTHKKEEVCPICSLQKVYQIINSGFEAAHIVAEKFMGDVELSVLYLIPSCSSCNNEMRDICLLDYLYVRGRLNQLKRILRIIYNQFISLHVLNGEDKCIWKILDYLYGKNRFPAGGGLANSTGIYEIARAEQCAIISEQLSTLAEQVQNLTKELLIVTNSKIPTITF